MQLITKVGDIRVFLLLMYPYEVQADLPHNKNSYLLSIPLDPVVSIIRAESHTTNNSTVWLGLFTLKIWRHKCSFTCGYSPYYPLF